MSKRFLILTSSLWLCGFFSARAQTKISNQEVDPSAKEVKQLFSSISCSIDSKDVHRSWCPVTKMGTSPLSIPHQLIRGWVNPKTIKMDNKRGRCFSFSNESDRS